MITVLCGGVGAARFLRALRATDHTDEVVGVVNTGDDTVLHGLSISPDIDTITYTLAGAIDPDRGWGLRVRLGRKRHPGLLPGRGWKTGLADING